MTIKHVDLVDNDKLHILKGQKEANVGQIPSKGSDSVVTWIDTDGFSGPTGPTGPSGSLAIIDVIDIDDPSAEFSLKGFAFGEIVVAHQVVTGDDDFQTQYLYDTSNTNALNPPYTLSTLEGGDTRWLAVSGKNQLTSPMDSLGGRFIDKNEIHAVALSDSTGIIGGGEFTINADPTKFDIAAGHAHIVDTYTDSENPVTSQIVWDAFTAVLDLHVTTSPTTFIGLERGAINPDGTYAATVIQSDSLFTSADRRDVVEIGFTTHVAQIAIENITQNAKFIGSPYNQLNDLIVALGSINVSGNVYSPNVAANLTIDKSAGVIFDAGINYANSKKTPNELATPSSLIDSYFSTYQDGVGGFTNVAPTTILDVGFYDDGSGTLAAVATNRFSIFRMFYAPSFQTVMQYGQATYSSLTDAEAAINSEVFNKNPSIATLPIRGWIIAKGNAVDLTDIATAKFITAGKFGDSTGGGATSSTATLQSAYNNGQDIKTSTLNGSVIIQDADTPTALNILEVNRSNAASSVLEVSTEGVIVDGTLDIIHTAVNADDHALELDVNASGFGDVKAIDIDYITGAIATGDDEAIILVNIDESLSVGGDVAAIEVLATSGSASVHGVLSGVGVGPIRQLSGAFGDMTSALVNAVDRLTDFTTVGIDIQMFVADNDTVTIGDTVKFEEIEFLLAIFASQTIQPTFEFSTGVGTWTSFTPVDGTNGMRNNGVIAWLDSDVPTWAVGLNSEYLIRITRTRNGLTTPPTESLVQVAEASEYFWNADAHICAAKLKIGAGIFADNILDEDDLISDSPTALASQQSIKAYVDNLPSGVSTFSALTDTPANYTAASLQSVRVNAGETALEFFTPAAGGSGDVVGPASSTDNAIARYDLATGKLLQDSNVLIDDDGRIAQTGLGNSVYVGIDAGLNEDLTDNKNVGLGYSALKLNVGGLFSVAIGAWSMDGASSVLRAVAVGMYTQRSTTGDGNTTVGYGSGSNITSGMQNVTSGQYAGNTITTGSRNICIGLSANPPLNTTSDHLNIGDVIQGDLATGKIGIGTAAPTNKLELKGSLAKTISGTTAISGGTPTMTGSGTFYKSELSIGCAVEILGEIFTVTAIGSDTNATVDSNHSVGTGFIAITTDEDMLKVTSGDDGALFRVDGIGSIYAHAIKRGTSQALAGANVDEIWVDSATNALKIGV